ncbi:MAG TPA: PDZ domain-containing protein, partial [Acidimicrobiales bacterium]|nr:PDZ domain-containing protein [Acidimicrobiales bacterium]
LGDPEYTLLDGIVAKARADGDTNWASVDSVIEHTAPIQPGNSGGPLIDENGQVVGINYAGGDLGGTGTSQFFAIGGDLALPTVEILKNGDYLSLGVNGQAVVDDSIGLAGIFVSSVDTNSPAGTLGLQPGDIIEDLEGLPMATDGTMKDYCDVLQSHAPTDKLRVDVLRFDENLSLRGEFNGRPLSPVESIVDQLPGEESTPQVAAGSAYTDYMTVTDDTGRIQVSVPTDWDDLDPTPNTADDGSFVAPELVAAPDVDGFLSTFDVPGVDIVAWDPDPTLTLADWMNGENGAMSLDSLCDPAGIEDYDDGYFTGLIGYWTGCGGTDTEIVAIASAPPDDSLVVTVLAQLLTQADFDALDHIIASFTAIAGGTTTTAPTTDAGTGYTDYVTITDDTGRLTIDVPVEWEAVTTVPATDVEGNFVAPYIAAAPDLEDLFGTYDTPGVEFMAFEPDPGLTLTDWLDMVISDTGVASSCIADDVEPYDDGVYTGLTQRWTDCAGTPTQYVIIVAEPGDGSVITVLGVQLVTPADQDALDRIIASFTAN